MTDPVNLIELIEELPRRQRGRACIVLTQNYLDQREWCSKLSQLTGAEHIDMLDHLEGTEESKKLSSFSIEGCFNYLANQTTSQVLIVSGLEFLMATWANAPSSFEQFASIVEMWSKKPALLIVTRYNSELAQRKFTRYPDKLFVVNQQNTISLA